MQSLLSEWREMAAPESIEQCVTPASHASACVEPSYFDKFSISITTSPVKLMSSAMVTIPQAFVQSCRIHPALCRHGSRVVQSQSTDFVLDQNTRSSGWRCQHDFHLQRIS